MLTKLFILFTIFLNISCAENSLQDQKKKILGIVPHLLNNFHFKPIKIDDELSKQSFDFYLKRLDFSKRFFLKEDIEKLKKYINHIDDEIQEQSLEFFLFSHNLIEKRIKEAKIYLQFLDKAFDYNKKEEYINLDTKNLSYAATTQELSNRWKMLLKYQTLLEIITLEDQQKNQTNQKRDFAKIEKQARAKVKKYFEDMLVRLEKINENDRFTDYINSILSVYDPHTVYLPPPDEKNFNISISGQLEGIGAVLQEKEGMIKIVRIVPGSASWRQGDLKAGDIILKVGQGKKEPVDIVNMRLDEAVQLIRGKKNSEVRLTVKKINGNIIIIPIIRDIVVLEETFAKSATLMRKDKDKKIGYIHLPKFYRNFNKKNERSCAKDVEKELKILKEKKVDGIIIDLRNNGGGSLEDAIEMTGLFIKEGPVVQVKRREHKANVYRDDDPKIVYDGPLVVMVNTFSASASEIFAAAIQDYGRGVIVGSKSTYGKGTVQNFGTLSRYLPKLGKQAGSIKFTIQKFYRINGGATQLKGVIPNIILPDIYDTIDIGEREIDNAMAWDEIKRQSYDLWHLPYNIDRLKKNSAKRVNNHLDFKNVLQSSIYLKKQNDDQVQPLNLDEYRREYKTKKAEAKKFESLSLTTSLISAPTKSLSINNKVEAEKIKPQQEWMTNLQKDIYLEEAFFIMEDILVDY